MWRSSTESSMYTSCTRTSKFSLYEQFRQRVCTGPVHREDCGVTKLERVSEQWDGPQTLFFNSVMVIRVVCPRERAA